MIFSDFSYYELTFNQIAGAMFSQICGKGNHFQLFSKITDHNYDGNTISISDVFTKSINGNNVLNNTMAGCKLQVKWKDGSIFWVPLKYLKASNRIELSEYAINNNIGCEPALHWWLRGS